MYVYVRFLDEKGLGTFSILSLYTPSVTQWRRWRYHSRGSFEWE